MCLEFLFFFIIIFFLSQTNKGDSRAKPPHEFEKFLKKKIPILTQQNYSKVITQ